jgi:hypothetical protein
VSQDAEEKMKGKRQNKEAIEGVERGGEKLGREKREGEEKKN